MEGNTPVPDCASVAGDSKSSRSKSRVQCMWNPWWIMYRLPFAIGDCQTGWEYSVVSADSAEGTRRKELDG